MGEFSPGGDGQGFAGILLLQQLFEFVRAEGWCRSDSPSSAASPEKVGRGFSRKNGAGLRRYR